MKKVSKTDWKKLTKGALPDNWHAVSGSEVGFRSAVVLLPPKREGFCVPTWRDAFAFCQGVTYGVSNAE